MLASSYCAAVSAEGLLEVCGQALPLGRLFLLRSEAHGCCSVPEQEEVGDGQLVTQTLNLRAIHLCAFLSREFVC